jgi:hypothetical protein
MDASNQCDVSSGVWQDWNSVSWSTDTHPEEPWGRHSTVRHSNDAGPRDAGFTPAGPGTDLGKHGNPTRRTNNLRALDSFTSAPVSKRKLVPQPNTRHSAKIENVEIRLSPDLQALESEKLRVIYFNCRTVAVTPEIAESTVEIAHWVLEEDGVELDIAQIEFIDLVTGKIHRRKTRRPGTVSAIKNNGKIIETLWAAV